MSSPRNRRHQRTQGNTNTQYNRQTTSLHSHRPLASGCRRGMQLQCSVVWDCSSVLVAEFEAPVMEFQYRCAVSMVHFKKRFLKPQRRGLPKLRRNRKPRPAKPRPSPQPKPHKRKQQSEAHSRKCATHSPQKTVFSESQCAIPFSTFRPSKPKTDPRAPREAPQLGFNGFSFAKRDRWAT